MDKGVVTRALKAWTLGKKQEQRCCCRSIEAWPHGRKQEKLCCYQRQATFSLLLPIAFLSLRILSNKEVVPVYGCEVHNT